MSALNSTTIVAPTGSAVHINDLPRLHKPDEPAVVVGGFLPVAAHAPPSSVVQPGHPVHLAAAAAAVPSVPGNVGVGTAGDDGDVGTSGDPSGHSAAAVATATLLNQLLSFSAQMASGGGGGGSIPPTANGNPTAGSAGHKKCPYHRQCSRTHHHLHQSHQHLHQQPQQQQQQQPAANVQGHPYAAAWNRYRNGGGSSMAASAASAYPSQQRDAISTNVSPPPLNAVILAERYLMMEPVEGNNLYRCCDIKSHEELVCKIANNPCSNLLTAHFRLEGHPHVNALHKVIQGNNKTYLLFSPSEGDLHSYVRVRKRLREPEARRLCRQMCEVVKSCHEQGIVLRDLKLRKFVFADRERTHLKLESLEDAVVLDDPAEDLLQDKRGCPAYVSPEILRANTTYSGKAADMWSLGVILYTMLVGRYPFNDSEHASLFAKISRGQFTVPECLSSKARCLIRALLRRDPEERIASEDVLYHPWLVHDDSKDHAYGSHSSGGGSGSRGSTDDQCVPEWFDQSEETDSPATSTSTTRTHYAAGGFDSSAM